VFTVRNIFITRDLDTVKAVSVSVHAVLYQLKDHDEVSQTYLIQYTV